MWVWVITHFPALLMETMRGTHLWDYKGVTLVPMVTTFAKNSSFEIATFSHLICFSQKKHPEVLIIHRTHYPRLDNPEREEHRLCHHQCVASLFTFRACVHKLAKYFWSLFLGGFRDLVYCKERGGKFIRSACHLSLNASGISLNRERKRGEDARAGQLETAAQ